MRKLTTEEFIQKAAAKHAGKYLYDRTVYVNQRTKVVISCPKHGDFEQLAVVHLSGGSGCPMCGGTLKLNTENFVQLAQEKHGNNYDYSKVKYTTTKLKVTIICKDHGDFEQSPASHLRGGGCPDCGVASKAASQSLSREEFIARAKSQHGSRYDYSKARYVKSYTKLIITCSEHGDFEQTPQNHLNGHGCPGCASVGYQSTKPGSLYILSNGEGSYKVGITNKPEQRLKQLVKATPFTIERIALFNWSKGQYARQLETDLHRLLKAEHAGLTGFDGCTEWFKLNPQDLQAVLDLAAGYEKSYQRTKPVKKGKAA